MYFNALRESMNIPRQVELSTVALIKRSRHPVGIRTPTAGRSRQSKAELFRSGASPAAAALARIGLTVPPISGLSTGDDFIVATLTA